MPAYKFEALDAAGKSQSGLLDADNAKAARSQLRARQLVPLAVAPVTAASGSPPPMILPSVIRSGLTPAIWA